MGGVRRIRETLEDLSTLLRALTESFVEEDRACRGDIQGFDTRVHRNGNDGIGLRADFLRDPLPLISEHNQCWRSEIAIPK